MHDSLQVYVFFYVWQFTNLCVILCMTVYKCVCFSMYDSLQVCCSMCDSLQMCCSMCDSLQECVLFYVWQFTSVYVFFYVWHKHAIEIMPA